MEISEIIAQMASTITAFVTIGGALIWVYKILVSDPDKRLAEKIQKENAESAKEMQRENTESLRNSVEPLTKSIDLLNRNLADSARDRANLNIEMSKHAEYLIDHDKRITVLEIKKGDVK
ncbi:MAG: hypothetical protein WBA84_09850 [Carnobacterium sp.]|uniref:hypothetical protein n=1 Tax=Carnobacterium sp. TaxID=48221 RepID=UPI003C727107